MKYPHLIAIILFSIVNCDRSLFERFDNFTVSESGHQDRTVVLTPFPFYKNYFNTQIIDDLHICYAEDLE